MLLPRLLLAFLAFALAGTAAAQTAPVRLKVIGGLADLDQYVKHEAPFWTRRVPELTGGAVQAEIAPFDRSGIRAQDLPRLLRLGVVQFASVILSVAAGEDPELDGLDLPLLNPDIVALRRTTAMWRPLLADKLRDRYNVELLAIYTYPAQVLQCRQPFMGLADLRGRRIRSSSVAQAELLAALGAQPVLIPFAEIVPALRNGVVECVVTGALSGHSIGLPEVATHLSPQAFNWGVSFFAANASVWHAIPEAAREQLRRGLATLESDIWAAAEAANAEGLACATGAAGCQRQPLGRMRAVPAALPEAERHRLLTEVVLPGWFRRCGQSCADAWNHGMAAGLGLPQVPAAAAR
jgi:TRAP-type C4-dicarboxylate transport system substrate-binding protein